MSLPRWTGFIASAALAATLFQLNRFELTREVTTGNIIHYENLRPLGFCICACVVVACCAWRWGFANVETTVRQGLGFWHYSLWAIPLLYINYSGSIDPSSAPLTETLTGYGYTSNGWYVLAGAATMMVLNRCLQQLDGHNERTDI